METDPHDLNRLAAYLEGRLSDAESAHFVAHAAACVECRATLAAYGRAVAPRSMSAARWFPIAAMLAIGTVAGVVSITLNRPQPAASRERRQDVYLPRPAAVPAPPPAPAGAPPDRGLLTRRGTERSVAGKVFRLEAGAWIDATYDRFAMLPVVDAAGSLDKEALLARIPALRPFAALGEKVLVVHEGTVYRLGAFSAARL
jgi:hypothetical protein